MKCFALLLIGTLTHKLCNVFISSSVTLLASSPKTLLYSSRSNCSKHIENRRRHRQKPRWCGSSASKVSKINVYSKEFMGVKIYMLSCMLQHRTDRTCRVQFPPKKKKKFEKSRIRSFSFKISCSGVLYWLKYFLIYCF